MDYSEVLEHYLKPEVAEEVVKFSKGRWVGVLCAKRDEGGKPLFKRYLRGEPLKIYSKQQYLSLLTKTLKELKPRSFYASANIYSRLRSVEDLTISNVAACTPTWDVDNSLDKWRATLEVAQEILRFLEGKGVSESVYVKWSGEGCHVHLHEGAISPELRSKRNSMDLAYAIVEYVNGKLHGKYHEVALKHGASKLKVENKIDPQRLFTCPLSLHKELDKVCVCVRAGEISSFTPEEADPEGFKHYSGWDKNFVVGEADSLAEEAYSTIGPYPLGAARRRRRAEALDEQIRKWDGILEEALGGRSS